RPALRDVVVVQEGLVRRIHAAIETLEPTAALERLRYESMCGRHAGPFHGWWARFLLGWSHVRPDNAAHVDCRVCLDRDSFLEPALGWLVRHIDAAAVHVVLPPVIRAAETAFLVAAQEQRSAPMGTNLIDDPDAALRVAEGDQILAQESHALGWAIRFGQLVVKKRRHPVAAQQSTHR